MAVTKAPKTKTLIIEVKKGVDKAGDPIFADKSFSGVKLTATDESVNKVATALKVVLPESRNVLTLDIDTLVNA